MTGEKKCRQIVYGRAEQVCERCCRNGPYLSVHHRKKRSQGGKWDVSNCVLLCGTGVQGCHGFVETHATAAGIEGFHVAPWCEPRQVPLLWRGNKWSFLDDEGNVFDV